VIEEVNRRYKSCNNRRQEKLTGNMKVEVTEDMRDELVIGDRNYEVTGDMKDEVISDRGHEV
jgi:hypothetical protein